MLWTDVIGASRTVTAITVVSHSGYGCVHSKLATLRSRATELTVNPVSDLIPHRYTSLLIRRE